MLPEVNNESFSMKLNLLTMKFFGESSTLEEPFLSDYSRGSLFHICISISPCVYLYPPLPSPFKRIFCGGEYQTQKIIDEIMVLEPVSNLLSKEG